ncbi:ABC transporter permease [Blastococcus sp. TF02A-26]|uniref:ABC transporter permease n=1 Tax=Blastococcus sp. TF02A-26 TaxID=2250577 RepID=UPI000DEBAA52|nr:ABC transporter permease [Blastococcus sp. TF02A-26]RBY85172.1 ABC transporter permease [Blastococcus sp. TF02A-26]
MTAPGAPEPSRLLLPDVWRVGIAGLRARPLRAALSGLGIAIGICAMIAVLGLSESSRAELLDRLDRLGTNLLRVEPGSTLGGGEATLPTAAAATMGRMDGVLGAAAVGATDLTARRSDLIPEADTNGIVVQTATPDLLDTVGGRVAAGTFLDDAVDGYPVAVLGAVAAERLGISSVEGSRQVVIGSSSYAVVGILEPIELAPEIDRSVLIGDEQAAVVYGDAPAPTTVYVRAATDRVETVQRSLARAADPENPEEVAVSRPSDALAARAAASGAFTSLLLGLGAVALLVGGVGIANVMVLSVLERRREIGLRRALGATRRHVRIQFVVESLALSGVGGLAGVVLGSVVTAAYTAHQGQRTVLPAAALLGGLAAALLVGVLAGLYPAARAARLPPTEALRTA